MSIDAETKLRVGVGWVVTAVWSVSFLADLALGDRYEMPGPINALMMAVATGLFAAAAIKKAGGSGD